MAPGTQARLICEWPDLSLGDVVSVIRYDAVQGYLVRPNNDLIQEIWLPAHILSNYNRKPWPFKMKKNLPSTRTIPENGDTLDLPEIIDNLRDVTVQSGAKVVLKCRVRNCGRSTKIMWKKLDSEVNLAQNARFMLTQNDEGCVILTLDDVKICDSGTYYAHITTDNGTVSTSAVITVTDAYPPLPEPKIQILTSSSVYLTWDSSFYTDFYLEFCRLGTGEWLTPNNSQLIQSKNYTLENLTPGETYSFRLVAAQTKMASLPSVAVTLPVADNLRWQQEQFRRRYVELEEIDRGRFSIVKRAKDRGTQVEVALKQVSRRKQLHNVTQAEYALLASIQHINIIRSMALFDNAPHPGVDTIVLELVKGPYLFTYLSDNEDYTENDAKNYTRQLMSAICWLHQKNIAHLDIKPENILVDVSTPTYILKLIDFGDSVNTTKNVILPPACLEFASPELVLGQPVGKHTDLWAIGVFLYVLLSGVSPFLDDSMEETTANILKCDFCFPEEYFANVSNEAKELISNLLVLISTQRISIESCLAFSWIKEDGQSVNIISSARLKTFMQRRHPMNIPTTPTSPTSFKNQNIF